jgi:hypothetical protein
MSENEDILLAEKCVIFMVKEFPLFSYFVILCVSPLSHACGCWVQRAELTRLVFLLPLLSSPAGFSLEEQTVRPPAIRVHSLLK